MNTVLPDSQPMPEIHFWYGQHQCFGRPGLAQRQINILGNVRWGGSPPLRAEFQMDNDGKWRELTLGSDLHRLAREGDFNIEIEAAGLAEGEHQIEVRISASRGAEPILWNVMKFHYTPGRIWPLPCTIRWDEVKRLQEAVQVVDGHWRLTAEGIRTVDSYYDRMLAFGDATWRNYEVRTRFRLHGYNPPMPGPPTYDVTHVAIATRWPGHAEDGLQPNRQWYPLGATAEFRFTDGLHKARWRIFDGETFYMEAQQASHRSLSIETWYRIVHRVEDLPGERVLYSVKCWPDGQPEPARWDLQAIEPGRKFAGGSACLIAHHTDVTFGNVEVSPLVEDQK